MTHMQPTAFSDATPVGQGATPSSARAKTLAVFGATGGLGREVVDLALGAGYRVSALARDPAHGLAESDERVRVVIGDVADNDAVLRTVSGADAVACCLGAPALSRSLVRSEGTRAIVRAMKETGVQRLLCVSVLGARESRKDLPLFLRYLLFPLYLRRVVADHERQEREIAASDLDWTIVRPPTLTDGPHTGDYEHGFSGSARGLTLDISRSDVADFMLRQITSAQYRHRAVGVSYRR